MPFCKFWVISVFAMSEAEDFKLGTLIDCGRMYDRVLQIIYLHMPVRWGIRSEIWSKTLVQDVSIRPKV